MLFPIPDIVVVSTKSAIVLSVFAGPIIFNNWYLLGWGSMPRCHNSLLNCHFLVHRTCWRDDGEFMEPDVNRSSTFGEQRLKRMREREREMIFPSWQNNISRGKFGRVMKCSKKETGEVFAAKFVTCARREDRWDLTAVKHHKHNLHGKKLKYWL